MTDRQKEAIGFMLMAARASHMTSYQEERLESAMFKAFIEFTPEDALAMYNSLYPVVVVDEYSQLEFAAEHTIKEVA